MKLFFIFLSLLTMGNSFAQKNLVTNNGFEDELFGWNVYGASTTPWMLQSGKQAADIITYDDKAWRGLDQVVALPRNTHAVEVSVFIKTDNVVKGNESWKMALANIELLDGSDKKVSELRLINIEGSTDWQQYSKKIIVPAGVKKLKVAFAMGYATGSMFIDDVVVKQIALEDAQIKYTSTDNQTNSSIITEQLINGGFEDGLNGWPDYAGTLNKVVYNSGSTSLEVSNSKKDDWVMRRQTILIPKLSKEIKLSGWFKSDTVAVQDENWRSGMFYVSFLDNNSQPLSDKLNLIYSSTGQHDWAQSKASFYIPPGATAVQLHIGLGKTTGTLYADDIAIEFINAKSTVTGSLSKVDEITLQAAAPFKMDTEAANNIARDVADVNRIVTTNYNSYTVGTYKMDGVQPIERNMNFTNPDAEIQFALDNKMRIHAHTLLYWIASPEWFKNINFKEKLEAAAKKYIQTVMLRYKGKVASVDVANEFFGYNTGQISDDANNNIAATWRKLYASDDDFWHFLGKCFTWAKEADPAVKLFYNDYDQQVNTVKADSILAMVKKLISWGYPIDGLGIQMHVKIRDDEKGIYTALEKMAATGLLIHVSEVDISLNLIGKALSPVPYSQKEKWRQYDLAQTIGTAYLQKVPAAQQWGITMWDVGDRDSWIPQTFKMEDSACLFDYNYNKKLCYYGLLGGVSGKNFIPEKLVLISNNGQAINDMVQLSAASSSTQNQQMKFVLLNNGFYKIVAASNKVLYEDNGKYIFSLWDGSDNQQWQLQNKFGGSFLLVNKLSNKSFSIQNKDVWYLSFVE